MVDRCSGIGMVGTVTDSVGSHTDGNGCCLTLFHYVKWPIHFGYIVK